MLPVFYSVVPSNQNEYIVWLFMVAYVGDFPSLMLKKLPAGSELVCCRVEYSPSLHDGFVEQVARATSDGHVGCSPHMAETV